MPEQKTYTDSKGRVHPVFYKKFPYSPLYSLVDIFEFLISELHPLVDEQTQHLLSILDYKLNEQVPHLKADTITDVYIIEEGYNF